MSGAGYRTADDWAVIDADRAAYQFKTNAGYGYTRFDEVQGRVFDRIAHVMASRIRRREMGLLGAASKLAKFGATTPEFAAWLLHKYV